MKTKIRSFVVLSAIAAFFTLPGMAQSAPSLAEINTPTTSIVVTTLEDSETDDGLSSLREAVKSAEFQPKTAVGPYTLFLPCIQRGCSDILFFDDFSAPAHGWTVADYNYGLFEYLNGEYRMYAKIKTAWLASRSGYTYEDYILEVDVRNATGTYGYYGFIFELTEDWSQFYGFQIDTYGQYVIFRVNSDGSVPWLSNGYSPSIHTGTANNHLKLERNGSQIWAYANGELLTAFPEVTSNEPRYVGLFTIADPIPEVDTRYDNFTVESISCGASYTYPVLAGAASDDNARELYSPEN